MNGLDREETLAAAVTHPVMLEYLPLEDALKALTFRYAPYMEVFNGAFPPHPIIQLDGDFTIDELRQIVAAYDAAMGTQHVVEGGQEVYLEHLYHYNCQSCKRWWTVADIPPAIGGSFTCPHCGHAGKVGSVKTAETPLRKPTDDLPPAP
jgi:hypothetical protein